MSSAAAPPPRNPRTRAEYLSVAFERALGKAIDTVSYSNFAECFPTISKNRPEVLRHIHQQMVTYWAERMRDEYRKICEERGVIPGLDELEALLKDAMLRKANSKEGEEPIAPATLSPQAVVAAHIAPVLKEAFREVKVREEEITEENRRYMKKMEEQMEEMGSLLKTLKERGQEWEEAVREIEEAIEEGKILEDIEMG